MVRAMDLLQRVRQAAAKLRMFDTTELQTYGMITMRAKHPRTARVYELDFYVTSRHNEPLFGFKACRDLELLRPVDENICSVTSLEPAAAPATCLTEADILAEYPDLFGGVGLLEGEVYLEVDSSVAPVQLPLRRLPVGVRDSVV